MIQDVAAAADLLRPIYDSSKAIDGYASIEVSPFLAEDGKATVEAAQRIWKKLARPNVMIKIPATKACIPAIEETLAAGINVNVTLIFSVEVYEQVAKAFISAVQRRVGQGLSVDTLASVASFFVSRVDALTEKRFDDAIKAGKAKDSDKQTYFGKVGIANSKLAYASYERLFKDQHYSAFVSKGAQVQRPLWASTGTKHPALSPVLYCEELAGRDTVNTMPPATLKALMEKATVEPRLHSGLKEAQALISGLENFGIDFPQILVELQEQGVKLFSDAYKELLASIENKSKAVA